MKRVFQLLPLLQPSQLRKIALAATIALAGIGQAACAAPSPGPAATGATPKLSHADAHAGTPAGRFWYDGDQRRSLQVDPDWVADFRGSKPAFERREEPGSGVTKSNALPAGVSPVLRDETGDPRALPGGVIVRLRDADLADPRKALIEAGLEPVRPIDPQERTWLVASPAGLESLALANRLHESGRFETATPNWWRSRALK